MENAETLAACRRCDWPLVGNESYCSNCGRRIDRSVSAAAILGIVFLLLAVAATGTCFLRGRHPPPASAVTSSRR
jgi:hypothetical protein